MINLQLHIEIMRLGAGEGGREEQNDFSQSKFCVERKWQTTGNAQETTRGP